MIYDLVLSNNPILKQKLELFDFNNPPVDPIELSKNMAETMMSKNGLGLASNQVGLPYRMFVVRSSPILACFNPKIVDSSEEEEEMEEGCLSYPNLILKVKRSKSIRFRFTQPNGETRTEKYTGFTARIIQHETDHLDGILFTSKISKVKLEMALKKMSKK